MDQRTGSGDWAESQRTPGNTLGLRAGDTLRSPDSLLSTHPFPPGPHAVGLCGGNTVQLLESKLAASCQGRERGSEPAGVSASGRLGRLVSSFSP